MACTAAGEVPLCTLGEIVKPDIAPVREVACIAPVDLGDDESRVAGAAFSGIEREGDEWAEIEPKEFTDGRRMSRGIFFDLDEIRVPTVPGQAVDVRVKIAAAGRLLKAR